MATTHDFEGLWSEAVDRYIDSTSRTLSEQGLLKQLKSSKELEEQLVKDHLSFTSFRAKRSKITGRIKKAVKPFTVISAVASSAISLSPFAPASTIFGAVVFVIQAADGVSEAYDWIDELFNKLGDFTVRLEEYCKESMSPRLEKKVVQILGCLLDILARSEKTIKTGRWKKYAAALFLGADEVTKASFDRLAKLFEDEQRLISAITFATNQRMDKRIEEIDQAVRQTHRAATNAEIGVDAIQQSQRRDTILNWISSADFPSQQSDAINKRQEGTGQWFLDASEFNSWIRGSKQTLFCHGMPGAGKTIVAAMAINHLFRTIQSSANGVVYIYCDYKMRGEQNVPSLFAAILRQLVQAQQLIPDDVLRLHEDHSRERTTLSYDEIFATLRSTLKNYSTVHLVIDALDELLGRQDGTLSQLLAKIRDLQKDANLNLMITSRFIPELKEEFEHATKLEVRASNGDVRKFVADQIYQLPKCIRGDEELPSVVEDNIVKAADGMFLLACLSVDLLRDTTTKKQAKSTLERISKNFQGSKRRLAQVYDELYCKTIKRIGTQPSMKRALARNVLSWITYAERPLTVEELRHAVAVEFGDKYLDEDNMPDVEEITTVCAGLVVVNEANNIIRFVHYTTQEYFERIREKWNRGIKVKIASSCLTYLSFNAFRSGSCGSYEEFQNRLEQYKLLDYASRYWGQHARTVQEQVSEAAFLFLKDNNLVSSVIQTATNPQSGAIRFSQDFPRHVTGLHLTAGLGLRYFSDCLSSQPAANIDNVLNPKDSHGRTPLLWAVDYSHEAVVGLLLGKGAVVDSKDNGGRTPLLWAADYSHEAVVGLLLAKGAVVDSKDNGGRTPLLSAAATGREAIVDQLLANGAEVDSKDNSGLTPLSCAALGGREAIVDQLLANGAEVDSKDNGGRTPLSLAAERGGEVVVGRLLANGAEVDSKDNGGRTPLSWAATMIRKEAMRVLLDKGADMECKDKHGFTPREYFHTV